MDTCGGCGPSDGERLVDLGTKHDLASATKLSQPSTEKDRARASTDKLISASGGRWSQEEKNALTREVMKPSRTLSVTNGVVAVNGIHKAQSGHPLQPSGVAIQSGERHSEQSLLNNNLIEEKCNLTCVDEKSYCLYHKFPAKVNNNVYPEKGTSVKDGMDEYFQMHASPNSGRQQPLMRHNESSPSRDASGYPDQLNLLNGEEEDEDDGCIYTYKGENFEANPSHLIDMYFSCGLPNTERSADDRGMLAHRLHSGRQDLPEQNNLFSPDMDFLEMDFDPGPNGDGDIDSDCEDNCVDECDSRFLNREHAAFSAAGAFSPISVLDRKANNYCSEMRNLMCKRCESSICDGKIDNVALNLSVHEIHSPFNIGRGPDIGFDDRPSARNSPLNVPRNGMNVPKDLNVELNEFYDVQGQVMDIPAPQAQDDEYDPPDNDSVENNLGEADIMDMIDDFCEDADDEDGDDSNSERYELGARFSRPIGSSEVTLREREDRGSGPSSFSKNINKTNTKTNNNNLGSVSAPEVSPAKEYSPLEKFGRSISFHNQLSSPKYENVCFSHRPKKEERPCDAQNKRTVPSEAEIANLEACAGRLHRRENSVFNILSDSSSQSGNTGCHEKVSGTSIESSLGSVGQHVSLAFAPASSPVSHSSSHKSIPPLTSLLLTTLGNTSCTVIGASGSSCPLPVKSLRPKNTNPTQDPNTASEGEGGGEDSCPRVRKVMIWTELQASARQVTQIATSACGATAIINVLLALDYPYTVEEVQKSIQTRLRAETAPVVDYLFSRSVAGTTHKDLINGVKLLSQGAIKAKFFHMFPKRAVQLSRWLAQWISRGGVPLATLNLQVGVAPGQTIPDAWHHQMIFGVGPQGIYLTNPLECVSDCLLGDQLCTDSVLLIRRADVVGRWGQGDRLIRLTRHPDARWREMNVLGQVVGVLKEQAAPPVVQGRRHLTSHVAIPAAYQSGVTIFMRSDNPQLHMMMQAEELPLLE